MPSTEEHEIRQRLIIKIKGYTILELRAVTIDHRLIYRVTLEDPRAPQGQRMMQDAYPKIIQKINRLPAR